jgi:hypothetical protein
LGVSLAARCDPPGRCFFAKTPRFPPVPARLAFQCGRWRILAASDFAAPPRSAIRSSGGSAEPLPPSCSPSIRRRRGRGTAPIVPSASCSAGSRTAWARRSGPPAGWCKQESAGRAPARRRASRGDDSTARQASRRIRCLPD